MAHALDLTGCAEFEELLHNCKAIILKAEATLSTLYNKRAYFRKIADE
ncbi:hypothetical protein FNYG_10170 [Fusarium nygamai]|uniref:Uncharacterized protein n=1 Tax=Gibberella nygamai TaxID=42673 RepID=A0A2K0W3A4_GIBNY|nr:hypothetical protein FNYG_10170 [Fusarium nygamai]